MDQSSKKLPGEIYSKDQINIILKSISKKCPTGLRNRALIAVLYGAGLRISEALDLLPGDIDLEIGKITVRHGKGDKFRVVGIPESYCGIIQLWLDKRKALGVNGSKPLFCTITNKSKGKRLLSPGDKMSSDYVRGFMARISKRIERKTGNKMRVHSHGFRQTMASELVQEGCNIIEVQDQLGHSNLNTTQKYIKKIAPQQLVDRMFKRKSSFGG